MFRDILKTHSLPGVPDIGPTLVWFSGGANNVIASAILPAMSALLYSQQLLIARKGESCRKLKFNPKVVIGFAS
mgnify:FL=1